MEHDSHAGKSGFTTVSTTIFSYLFKLHIINSFICDTLSPKIDVLVSLFGAPRGIIKKLSTLSGSILNVILYNYP